MDHGILNIPLAKAVPQQKVGVHLSSAQRFVLRAMVTNLHGITHLARNYDRTRGALQDKGLIVFNADRGMYEVTDAGRAALESNT